jgi:dynamin-binding protein
LYDSFKGPAALIAKHNKKAVDFARYNSLKGKDETPDKKLAESAETFQSLHASLLEELPVFMSLAGELVEAIIHQFSIAQSGKSISG